MKNKFFAGVFAAVLAVSALGCGSQEIPQAHKGRMFDKTGAVQFYAGGNGFEGPILNPGTVYTGLYDEVRMVECTQKTVKEPMTALTKDGVQFSLDIYVRYSANCEDVKAVESILTNLAPSPEPVQPGTAAPSAEPHLTITANQLYSNYIRPSLGEAVRQAISPLIANDVNSQREVLFGTIRERFFADVTKLQPKMISVYEMNLSNLDFPEAMDVANAERAAQAILKDKAIAEREKVQAQIETAKLEVVRRKVEAEAEAAKIDVVGAALHRNPEYYLRDVYYYAAEKGGSVMLPSDPNVILQMTPGRK